MKRDLDDAMVEAILQDTEVAACFEDGAPSVSIHDAREPVLELRVTRKGTSSWRASRYRRVDASQSGEKPRYKKERLRLGGFPELGVAEARLMAGWFALDATQPRTRANEQARRRVRDAEAAFASCRGPVGAHTLASSLGGGAGAILQALAKDAAPASVELPASKQAAEAQERSQPSGTGVDTPGGGSPHIPPPTPAELASLLLKDSPALLPLDVSLEDGKPTLLELALARALKEIKPATRESAIVMARDLCACLYRTKPTPDEGAKAREAAKIDGLASNLEKAIDSVLREVEAILGPSAAEVARTMSGLSTGCAERQEAGVDLGFRAARPPTVSEAARRIELAQAEFAQAGRTWDSPLMPVVAGWSRFEEGAGQIVQAIAVLSRLLSAVRNQARQTREESVGEAKGRRRDTLRSGAFLRAADALALRGLGWDEDSLREARVENGDAAKRWKRDRKRVARCINERIGREDAWPLFYGERDSISNSSPGWGQRKDPRRTLLANDRGRFDAAWRGGLGNPLLDAIRVEAFGAIPGGQLLKVLDALPADDRP